MSKIQNDQIKQTKPIASFLLSEIKNDVLGQGPGPHCRPWRIVMAPINWTLRASQLFHFLQTFPAPDKYCCNPTTLEEYCVESGTFPHTLSTMYNLLESPPEDCLSPYLVNWKSNLGRTFTKTQRSNITRFALKSSFCTKVQETNFKILNQWYCTPSLFHKYFLITSALCWRCQEEHGTLLHIFWSCTKLSGLWREIRTIIQKFTTHRVPNDPAFFLLHASAIPAKVYKKSILRHLLNAAKSCIPLIWKQAQPPTVGLWLRKVKELNWMLDLVLTTRQKQEIYTHN